jgi:hypothetical protein
MVSRIVRCGPHWASIASIACAKGWQIRSPGLYVKMKEALLSGFIGKNGRFRVKKPMWRNGRRNGPKNVFLQLSRDRFSFQNVRHLRGKYDDLTKPYRVHDRGVET